MHLLGRVDEQKEEREGARGDRAQLERKGLDLGEELVERRRGWIAVATRAAGAAEGLDRLERQLTLEAADDAAERGGQPADVFVQGDVLAADRRAGNRDGAERGGRAGPGWAGLAGLVGAIGQGAAPEIDGRRGGCPILQGRRGRRRRAQRGQGARASGRTSTSNVSAWDPTAATIL
jgi:hypothetical protein